MILDLMYKIFCMSTVINLYLKNNGLYEIALGISKNLLKNSISNERD